MAARVSSSTSRKRRDRKRAAIFIGTPVDLRIEKLRQQISVGGINIDDVEARFFGPQDRGTVPVAISFDIGLVHGLTFPRCS